MTNRFDTKWAIEIDEVDRVVKENHSYTEPTDGMLDLSDMGELELGESVAVEVWEVWGELDGVKRLSATVEKYPEHSVLYISDLWVDESLRGQGIGTEMLERLTENYDGVVYLYASSSAMKHVVQKVGFTEIQEGWFKIT